MAEVSALAVRYWVERPQDRPSLIDIDRELWLGWQGGSLICGEQHQRRRGRQLVRALRLTPCVCVLRAGGGAELGRQAGAEVGDWGGRRRPCCSSGASHLPDAGPLFPRGSCEAGPLCSRSRWRTDTDTDGTPRRARSAGRSVTGAEPTRARHQLWTSTRPWPSAGTRGRSG